MKEKNFKKGDKFIIEIEDVYEAHTANALDVDNKLPTKLFRIKGFNSLVFDINGLSKLAKIESQIISDVCNSYYEDGFLDGRMSVALDVIFEEETGQYDESEVSCSGFNCNEYDIDKIIKEFNSNKGFKND